MKAKLKKEQEEGRPENNKEVNTEHYIGLYGGTLIIVLLISLDLFCIVGNKKK